MTDLPKPKPGIRKVWLPAEMKVAIREYCWRMRTKPSPFMVGIIQEVIDFPENFEGADIPPAGTDHQSVYIDPAVWEKGTEVAARYRVSLAGMIRVGVARELAAEGILWDVSTVRPRNDRIPDRE
jgi:hypothetical protein